jgi:hypothetical protein
LVVAIMMKTTASRSRINSHIEFILSSIKYLPLNSGLKLELSSDEKIPTAKRYLIRPVLSVNLFLDSLSNGWLRRPL